MSTTTTSASSLIAIPCATVAPTLPPPTTVTFVFIESLFRCDICGRIIIQGRGTRDEGRGHGLCFCPSCLVPLPCLTDACRFLQNSECDRRHDEKVGEGAAACGLPRFARRRVARARRRLLL